MYCDAVVDLFGLEHKRLPHPERTDGGRQGRLSPSVRLGTRGSPLALWQAEHVRQLLARQRPDLECEIVVITTTGDRILDTPLPAIGGKGVFTAELEQALHERSIDLAVHSLKDLPTAASPGLAVGVVHRARGFGGRSGEQERSHRPFSSAQGASGNEQQPPGSPAALRPSRS